MASTLLTTLLILLALGSILTLSLWVSLRHRSRAIHGADAATSAAEAGRQPPDQQQPLSPVSPTITPRRVPWWTTLFQRAMQPRTLQRSSTGLSHGSGNNAELKYLCPAPGQMYQLPTSSADERAVKLQPHPSIKRNRKAPPLVATWSAYKLTAGGLPVEGLHRRQRSTEGGSSEGKGKEKKRDEAISPTHTGADWPLPLQQQQQQPLPEIGRVVTADGNFEHIHLEKARQEKEEGGAWMGVARRVVGKEHGHGYGETEGKPLPEVMEGGHGRHGSFDFERGGFLDVKQSNSGGWKLSWWGRSEAVT